MLNSDKLQPCLLSTGVLWEFCDRLPTLPKNNKEAVSSVLSREEQLINDAIEELEEVSLSSLHPNNSNVNSSNLFFRLPMHQLMTTKDIDNYSRHGS